MSTTRIIAPSGVAYFVNEADLRSPELERFFKGMFEEKAEESTRKTLEGLKPTQKNTK